MQNGRLIKIVEYHNGMNLFDSFALYIFSTLKRTAQSTLHRVENEHI
jgi:hypothetical protein